MTEVWGLVAIGFVLGLAAAFAALVFPERRRAERERLRADRIFDSILMEQGHRPASEEGIQQVKEAEEKWQQSQDEMKEVYATQTEG